MDHVIDPAAPQSAGHDHDHHHDHGMGDYYLEQLLTVFICGAFGVVAVLMYNFDMLKYLVAPKFFDSILIGGIGLLAVTGLRGVSLWRSVGHEPIHDHDHAHDHAGHNHAPGEVCDDPAHAGGDHGDHSADDHAHGNIYWRIVVLAFPIVLFLMGLPNKGIGQDAKEAKLGKEGKIGLLGNAAERGGEATYDFQSLSMAAASEDKRHALEGTPAKIKGQLRYIDGSPDEFGLFYMKITCCATDMVPLKARIKVDRASLADALKTKYKHHAWVEISGTIQFAKMENGEYLAVLRVKDAGGITPTEPVY